MMRRESRRSQLRKTPQGHAPARMQTTPTRLIATARSRLLSSRGDVPGWVLVTVMTAGLVTALWLIAD
ncbi:MAG: hypothetical protein RL745_898, partial [Actinomycetota bacterium]